MINGSVLPNQLGPTNGGSRAVVAQTASWLDRANAILSQTHPSAVKSKTKSTSTVSTNGGGPSLTFKPSTTTSSTATGNTDDVVDAVIISKSNSDEVEKEMKEVEQLIHEGPIIQKTSAGLSTLLEKSSTLSSSSQLANSPSKKATSTLNSITETVKTTSTTNCYHRDTQNKRKVSDDRDNDQKEQQQSSIEHRRKGKTVFASPPLQIMSSSSEDRESPLSRLHDKRMRRSFSHNNVQDHEDAASFIGFLSSVREAAASNGPSSSK